MLVVFSRRMAQLQLSVAHYLKQSQSSSCMCGNCRDMTCLLWWWNPNTWIGRVDSHERKLVWKCSHQQENGLRKPLHWEAVLPQEDSMHRVSPQELTPTYTTRQTLHRLAELCPDWELRSLLIPIMSVVITCCSVVTSNVVSNKFDFFSLWRKDNHLNINQI